MDISRLQGKKVLITGATGLIGSTIVSKLMEWNLKAEQKIEILALARDQRKAELKFGDYINNHFQLLVSDICNLPIVNLGVDYIIHGASQTASRSFVETPIETIMTAVFGTKRVLDFAVTNTVKGFVYLSSMEVYGYPDTEEKIDESHYTNLNTMLVRSSYPESKRMCETLCSSYLSECGVPIKVVRLTQTFGPGVDYSDGRVFAEFARCVIERRDIVLNTRGMTKRSYLYTDDAVNAILTILLDGEVGQAYNAANESTYCSIYDMASMVASRLANNEIKVKICESELKDSLGYAPLLNMNLNTRKLRRLGWMPRVDLEEMFSRMISYMRG